MISPLNRWMIVTESGIKYPFRCFGFKDRETWLKKVNDLPCINTSEEDKKQALKGAWNFSAMAQRLSFSVGGGTTKKGAETVAFTGHDTRLESAESQQQVIYSQFLYVCFELLLYIVHCIYSPHIINGFFPLFHTHHL